MKIRFLIALVLFLAAVETGLRWSGTARAAATRDKRLAAPLLDPAILTRAHWIVVREKPQSKVISNENGVQVKLVVDHDAPIRETLLHRAANDRWVVANDFDLDVDAAWLGQTMRDLSEGRLVRYVTDDAKLASDLELNLGEIRIEDESHHVLKRLEFGRKDGGETYQFVRIDGREVYVAKHAAEIVGSPTAWIVTRVLAFPAREVREIDVAGAGAIKPTAFERPAAGAPLADAAHAAAPATEALLDQLLAAPAMFAASLESPEAAAAQAHIVARVRLIRFDGREYHIAYGVAPKGTLRSAELKDYPLSGLAFAFLECSDPSDLAARSAAKAVLIYDRGATADACAKFR